MLRADEQIKLMDRISVQDEQALEELYFSYSRILFGIVISMVKSREEAEDLLQDVFIIIWKKAHIYDETRGKVFSWIVNLTRNKAIDRIRSKGYITQQKASHVVNVPEFTYESNKLNPLETIIVADRAKLVRWALKKIPTCQSKVLNIYCYRGMTQSEISSHLNIPLGTVKTQMRQGMLNLKDILEKHNFHNY